MKPDRTFAAPLVLVLFAVAIATAWIAITPFGWDNDEPGHYWTARDIRERGGLPVAAEFPAIVVPDPPAPAAGQFRYHSLPPTYYVILAWLFGLHWEPTGGLPPGGLTGRALSALLFVITLLSLYKTAELLSGGNSRAAAVVAGGIALIPQVASIGASITADALAMASAGLLLWATVHWIFTPSNLRGPIFVGLAAALVIMSRPTALPLLLIPAGVFLFRLRRGLRRSVRDGLIVALTAVAPNIWWLVRNVRMLGDPLGSTTHLNYVALKGVPAASDEFAMFNAAKANLAGLHDLFIHTDWLGRFHTRVWFTGRYDSAGLTGWLFLIVLATAILLAIAIAFGAVKMEPRWRHRPELRAIPLLLLAVIGVEALVAAYHSFEYGAFVVGRYSVPALAAFLTATLGIVSSGHRPSLGLNLGAAFTASMAVVHVVFWAGFLLPDLMGEVLPR